MTLNSWRATSVQMESELAVSAADPAAAWSVIQRNLARGVAMIDRDHAGPTPARVYVLPEFAFQGAPQGMPVRQWIEQACCHLPGPITEPLQALARRLKIYIGGNQFETAAEWPGRYFNTCFLIDPHGEVILRYRRITTAAFPSPHDFMDQYLERTPQADVFPVVDTELGRIAMIPCSEISVPEVSRVMMMKGAEVILHPTNGKRSIAEDAAKIVRCAENKFYLVSANVAGPIGFSVDRTVMGGRSRIIDFEGNFLAFEDSAEPGTSVSAVLDLQALRDNRANDAGPSSLLRARWEMYRPYFAAASFYPPNQFLDAPMTHVQQTAPAIAIARGQLARAGMALGTAGERLID